MEDNFDKNLLEALEIAEKVSSENRMKPGVNTAHAVKTDKQPEEKQINKTVQTNEVKPKAKQTDAAGNNSKKKAKQHNTPKKLKDPWSLRRKIITIAIIAVLILVVLPVCVLAAFAHKGKNELAENATSDAISFNDENVSSLKVTYNGTNYTYNEDVITILVFGVDSIEDEEDTSTVDTQSEDYIYDRDDDIIYTDENGSEYVKYGGNVDMCFLIILNTETDEMNVISINRDSMTDVNICTTEGVVALTDEMQLTLAYSYGDGGKVSCENFTNAVSGLLNNLPINAYIAVDMDGVGDINDAAKGVTLIVQETLSAELFEKSSVTLEGEQAYDYLEAVTLSSIGDNARRILRQNQYFGAWISRVVQCYSIDKSVLKDVYNAAKPYIETNLDMYQIIYLAGAIRNMDLTATEVEEISGEYTRTDYFDEYYLDEEALVEMLLKYFYTEAE